MKYIECETWNVLENGLFEYKNTLQIIGKVKLLQFDRNALYNHQTTFYFTFIASAHKDF